MIIRKIPRAGEAAFTVIGYAIVFLFLAFVVNLGRPPIESLTDAQHQAIVE